MQLTGKPRAFLDQRQGLGRFERSGTQLHNRSLQTQAQLFKHVGHSCSLPVQRLVDERVGLSVLRARHRADTPSLEA